MGKKILRKSKDQYMRMDNEEFKQLMKYRVNINL